jgi:hypothetical protein
MNHDSEFLRVQLQQAIETWRMQYVQILQIATALIIADVTP